MAFKSRQLLPSLLFLLFLLSITTAALARYSHDDPEREYEECQQHCQQQQHVGPKQQQQCQQQCQARRQEQQQQQRDPQQVQEECRQLCQQRKQGQQQQQICQQQCVEQQQQQHGRRAIYNPTEQQQQQQRDPQQVQEECRQLCHQQERGQQQQQICQQQCVEQQQRQQQQQRDPQQVQEECRQLCQQREHGQQQQQTCQQQCVEQQQRHGGGGAIYNPTEQQQQQQQRDNPYLLDEQSFQERFRTQHGYTRVSQRFSQISNLLRGIENYRLALFEANPSTFMIPHHLDADAVFFIVRGKGTITLVHQQNKQSYNLERGNVMRVPAGALFYLVNRDNNDKFQIASLFRPVSTPTDSFREFFAAGGQNPESFINTFSDEIVQAAYDTDKQSLDRLFNQQNNGEIVKASQEQIRALSQGASSSQKGSSRWTRPGSQSSQGPYDLLSQTPEDSNDYGKMYRIDANQYSQLQDLDLEVAFYRINQGAMLAPFYNSRATSLVFVTDGAGSFEMACPHLSSSSHRTRGRQEQRQQEEQSSRGTHYQRVSARLSPRRAFIVPAGHPVSIVASNDQHLEIVAFKLNAENNQRNYLAGANNLLNQLEREAKELSFNMPAREVESILNNQKQSVFLPGPNQRQQQQRQGGHGGDDLFVKTIADFVGF